MESLPTTPEEYRAWWKETTSVPYGYCWCGCGTSTSIAKQSSSYNNTINGQPLRYVSGHNSYSRGPDYEIDADTGCWNWLKGKTSTGYGVVTRKGKQKRAHRLYYEEKYGKIPDGHQAHHLCENRGCVNPKHLVALPAKEHYRLSPTVKLSHEKVRRARELLSQGMARKDIARLLGVSISAIHDIAQGRRWV